MKAIILAGGFGTRLRSITGDEIPKCMARGWFKPGNRKVPWLRIVVDNLKAQDITDITVALHYKAGVVIDWFGDKLKYKVEEEPLGTGGAIKNCIGDDVSLVINGDTYSSTDFQDMLKNYTYPLTIARNPEGVSAGVYIVSPDVFKEFPQKAFSFEKDIIPNVPHTFYEVEWFSDMGCPEGYQAMQI